MNYPIWIMQNMDVGALVALIAIPHVYISHLAVGGGLFLVLTEHLAYKRNNPALLDYVRRHTWFFLLLTMVFGGISGVGIWFIIALAQPAATSKLIHEFVFGWATEWVFFIVEIAALLIYHYLFGKLKPKPHLIIGWIYFAAAWLSMVIIHGILSFMLTPGRWLETGNFWHGFFNPGYWPGLAFRTAMALTIAGLFGLVTAVRTRDADLRNWLTRYCATWVSVPFVLMILAGKWYWEASNDAIGGGMLKRFYFMEPYGDFLIWSSVIIFIGGALLLMRQPRLINAAIVTVLVVIGLGWMGSFEYLRENARRPWIIQGYMYSNSILAEDVERLNKEGFLENAVWARTDTEEHMAKDLLTHQCLVCHTVDGHRGLMDRTATFDEFGLTAQLTGMGKVQTYMPPFVGTEEEKELLARYIARDLNGKPPRVVEPVEIVPAGVELEHGFTAVAGEGGDAPAPDEYVVFCWNDLGMHCLTDADSRWIFLPPANALWAQVVRRGDPPQIVTEGVTVHYEVEEDHSSPADEVEFWKYADELFGVNLEPNIGLAGFGMSGEMEYNPDHKSFIAEKIPPVPYRRGGEFNPYPMYDIEVHAEDGTILTGTRVNTPTSTEMGCRNCHGGEWSHGVAGISVETADSVLATHDRLSGTDLLAEARVGTPHKCQDCHADPALGAEGLPGLLNLSSAMHGFHTNYLSHLGAGACAKCHPSEPDGATRCLRGRHAGMLECIDCHGTLSEHGLSVLKAEDAKGKPGAARLMKNLVTETVASQADVNPRTPWLNEPDCLNCHIDFKLQEFNAFNKWTAGPQALFRMRTDCNGLMCSTCHGPPHAVYPVENPYGEAIDNYQSLQYLGRPGTIGGLGTCTTCHLTMPEVNNHHLRMLR